MLCVPLYLLWSFHSVSCFCFNLLYDNTLCTYTYQVVMAHAQLCIKKLENSKVNSLCSATLKISRGREDGFQNKHQPVVKLYASLLLATVL